MKIFNIVYKLFIVSIFIVLILNLVEIKNELSQIHTELETVANHMSSTDEKIAWWAERVQTAIVGIYDKNARWVATNSWEFITTNNK